MLLTLLILIQGNELLAVNIGNTHIAVRSFDDFGKSTPVIEFFTHPVLSATELRALIEKHLVAMNDKGVKADCVLSSVVPAWNEVFEAAFPVGTVKKIDCRWPFSFQILPVPNDKVGVDRLVNAEAVIKDYGFPSLVLDAG